ncbi:toll/interleukin-1 receptor domain-containing protein [Tahibacter harae]|uniref:Toll/interleukin-1 receptor domain-containing protein n=1 Tax=Tahibacter harae TaxID=2963937 RepID=A0ABT1QS88_9GAMM|nr:toll/interleukin-1 receptor domain-containing protein [Tahibacter harae]MCQ4165126.1 toll/interleukin-1 receptor domain-containing protein [Tahibacter harae]
MKVFISWSGARSKAVAELLSDWISCVLQNCRPWISTRDIDRGSLWFSEIHDQLKDTSIGVVVLTMENRERPWILFEAGALAKGLSTSRVCTLLVDLEAKDIQDPLAQFNHTVPNREGMKNLVFTLNAALGENRLRDRTVTDVFDTYWPQFEHSFAEALKENKPGKAPPLRQQGDVLNEILEVTRALSNRMRELELQTMPGIGEIGPNLKLHSKRLDRWAKSPAGSNADGQKLFFDANGRKYYIQHGLWRDVSSEGEDGKPEGGIEQL